MPYTTTSLWPARTDLHDPPTAPCPQLLARLDANQRTSFLNLSDRLPPHLRDIIFDLEGSGWSPSVIDSLGDVLCEFPDAFSISKTDFGSCSLMPFKITVPPNSEPVTSRPYRINPILAKKADAVLDQYLAAGLIQQSTSPYSSLMVAISKKDGGVLIAINYKTPTAPDATTSLAPTLLASPHPPLRHRTERAAYTGYRLGWARVPPFKTHSNNPASPLHRRRLWRLPPTGITHGAQRHPQ